MGLLIVLAAFLVLLLLGLPVAFAILIPSLAYYALDPAVSIASMAPTMLASINSFPLVAIPFFLLLGSVAGRTSVTARLYDFAESLLRRAPGRLGYVNIATSLGFSWMSGSAISDTAALSRMQVPTMLKRGYPTGYSLGITAGSSIIAPMMPPSIAAVLYAVVSGVSLGGMLLAGIGPALVLTALLIIYTAIWARFTKAPIDQHRAVPSPLAGTALRVLPVLGAPVILIGGILGGVFTPTEGSAVAVLYLMALGVLDKSLDLSRLVGAMRDTCRTLGSVLLIVVAAGLFGQIVTLEGGAQRIANGVLQLTDSPVLFLLLVNVSLLVVGMIMEAGAAILLVVPILLPAAVQYGIDPLHFGCIVILNLLIGLLTPPLGLIVYVISGSTGVPLGQAFRAMVPMLAPLLVGLIAVTYLPFISVWLPTLGLDQ